MSGAIPEKYRDLFSKRAFASLGTLMPDGRPQVTPVWCDLEGDLVVFNSAKGRQKDRNVRRDPRVAIAIVDPEIPTAIWKFAGAWSRSRSRAPMPTSTSWQRNILALISIRTGRRANNA